MHLASDAFKHHVVDKIIAKPQRTLKAKTLSSAVITWVWCTGFPVEVTTVDADGWSYHTLSTNQMENERASQHYTHPSRSKTVSFQQVEVKVQSLELSCISAACSLLGSNWVWLRRPCGWHIIATKSGGQQKAVITWSSPKVVPRYTGAWGLHRQTGVKLICVCRHPREKRPKCRSSPGLTSDSVVPTARLLVVFLLSGS